ncbi:uncharacterized protein LOC130544394 [Ursus arctos]|uniref:uncharacterized protein LOC130544394 n=1 Tax=Ursus arctos TaxID=9644 RepID=UPI002548F0B8|nr:uncharacterized protein LOC130544394 [Ursus arctos]
MSGSRRRKGRRVLFPALPAGVELDSRPWPPAPGRPPRWAGASREAGATAGGRGPPGDGRKSAQKPGRGAAGGAARGARAQVLRPLTYAWACEWSAAAPGFRGKAAAQSASPRGCSDLRGGSLMLGVPLRLLPDSATSPAQGLPVLNVRSSFLWGPCWKLAEEVVGGSLFQAKGGLPLKRQDPKRNQNHRRVHIKSRGQAK